MLLAACASLRTAGPGFGCGVPTWRLVQQAGVLRQVHTRHDAAASRHSLTATTGLDTASGVQEGSETDSTTSSGPEASSGSRLVHRQQQHAGRGLQQLPQASASLSARAAAAAGPEAAAIPAALHPPTLADQRPLLHKPYSHLLQGHYKLKKNVCFRIAGALCTDIEALHFARGSCSVQVSFVSHPADWDIKGYVRQHCVMQQLQLVQQWAVQVSDSAAGSTTQAVGPFQATLTHSPDEHVYLYGLPAQHIMQALGCGSAPRAVVLQERLLSSEGPQFLLHTMPVSREAGLQHGNKLAQMINRAGEGPGLQVFPGSVPEVAPAGNIFSNGSRNGAYIIPRVLVCSQLPADTTYPLELTIVLMDSQGQQLGQWHSKAYSDGRKVVLCNSRILPKFVGYSVAKALLPYDPTQGARLTLMLDTAQNS